MKFAFLAAYFVTKGIGFSSSSESDAVDQVTGQQSDQDIILSIAEVTSMQSEIVYSYKRSKTTLVTEQVEKNEFENKAEVGNMENLDTGSTEMVRAKVASTFFVQTQSVTESGEHVSQEHQLFRDRARMIKNKGLFLRNAAGNYSGKRCFICLLSLLKYVFKFVLW